MEQPADNPYITDPPTSFPALSELDAETAANEAAALREAIRYHDYRYYVENDPMIADRTYDTLFDRLQTLEEQFDVETPESPTNRVGGEPVDELPTVEHVAPMLSIGSGADEADVKEFDDRVRRDLEAAGFDPDALTYVCEPKFDGLSLEVVYEDGVFERATTRGDGHEGDDVTANVRTIATVPQRLGGEYPEFLAVRGEVYLPRSGFQALNRERIEAGDDPFANPRNAAAGSLRQLDPSVVADRPLAIYFYDVLDASTAFNSHDEEHERLPDYGLRVNTDWYRTVADIEAAIEFRDDLLEARDTLDYEVDGAVIKVNDKAACEALGSTSRSVRWAFAYKFPPRSGETTVRDIVIQVGRTGRLTPVALLDPVDVGGVTVSRASLHNREIITNLNVGIGDVVTIERAGDVIPQVEEVVEKRADGHFEFPDTCPVCDSPVEHDGPLTRCTGGLACHAQLVGSIEHYGSDTGLDIEGLGEETVETLVESGLVESLADLYTLTVEDLTTLDGWGEQSARNLLTAIDAAREPALDEFVAALGIPEVGPTIARDVAEYFETIDAVLDADEHAYQSVDGVGPTVANEITEFLANERNQAAIEDLRTHVDVQPVRGGGDGSLSGVTVVFTGTVEGWARDDLAAIVEDHGGNVTSSVSSNTDYLVVGTDPGQSKQADAETNNVPTINPEELFDILASHGIDINASE